CASSRVLLSEIAGDETLARQLIFAELLVDVAFSKDEDPIHQIDQLEDFSREHDNRESLLGRSAENPIDVELRRDVDAPSRIVQEQNVRPGREPARKHDLLLVASAQRGDAVAWVTERDVQSANELGETTQRRPVPKETASAIRTRGR